MDTSDSIQDARHRTPARIENLRSAQAGALRTYLRRAIENRIADKMRRAAIRWKSAARAEPIKFTDEAAPQYQQLLDDETWGRYLEGLKRLTPRHRRLVVGRVEFGYSYRQLALMERLSTPDAARMAFRHALARLSDVMPDV